MYVGLFYNSSIITGVLVVLMNPTQDYSNFSLFCCNSIGNILTIKLKIVV